MMGMIGRYEQITKLGNENAGTCFWCYAVREGQEYFIKEFPEPKYPTPDSEATPEQVARKEARCEAFEKEKTRIYQAVNNSSDGNAVRVTDFFRVGAKYYIAMPRVKAVDMEIEEIASLSEQEKRRICTVIVHAMAQLHAVHFVHSDVKHSNIMFVHSLTNKLTAKLIDYDAGFFEDTPPRCSEEVKGDQVYYAPEAIAVMYGGEAQLTCKLDIFALGILFHQYFTGALPQFDMEKYDSVGMAVVSGGTIAVSREMPADIHRLICQMLAEDPGERPTAQEVFHCLKHVTILPERDPVTSDNRFTGDAPARPGWWDMGDL